MPPHYEECIVFMLGKAYQTAHKLFKKKLDTHALTPVQFLVIQALWENEPATLKEISQNVSVDYATLSTLLDRMVKAGWVIKERDPSDKRYWQVSLTKKSRSMTTTFMAEQEETNQTMTQKFTESEKLLLFRMLKDLRQIDID